MDRDHDGGLMTPDRLTPSQFITQRVGSDAETICALLGDIEVLKARIAELEAELRKHEGDHEKDGEQAHE